MLREAGTERPFSSPLNKESARAPSPVPAATCRCSPPTPSSRAARLAELLQALPGAIVEKEDRTFMMVRTETLCRRCGGHPPVFEDGPKPTGLRYCMNGLALAFRPAGGSSS